MGGQTLPPPPLDTNANVEIYLGDTLSTENHHIDSEIIEQRY